MHMTVQGAMEAHQTGRSMRLDTLVRLRWFAVIGQTTAVLVVYLGLDYDLKIWACLAVIALAAWLNVALRIRFPMTQRLEPDRAAWLLGFDIAELAVLLFFTGGLQNPFAILFLGPVLISAAALPPRMTLMLGGFAIVCATVLVFVHDPLPWDTDPPLELPAIYFAHEREVFERDGMLYAASEFVERYPHEEPFSEWVRFRTVGDMSCTGGVRSRAATIEEVVREIAATRVTERGETRADDKVSEAAMEDRKRMGYF